MHEIQHLIKGVVIALLLLMPAWLWAAEPAGYVLMATGEVVAVQADQVTRPLERKSPFYSGESLRTGAEARAQVRFRDGSLISLRPDTEIRIDDFRYQQGDEGEDRNIFTLINGGFRTITGKIGKKDPKNYQMKSSVASIGVRGTTYEVVLDNGLNVAAWQGTIVVENQGGAITLGSQGVFNFAHVAGATARPLGLLKPPAVIGAEPETGVDEPSEPAREEAASEATVTQTDEDDAADLSQPTGSDDGPLDSSTRLVEGADTATTTHDTTQTSIFEPVVVESGDLRLEGVSLNRVGMAQTVDFATAGFDYLIAPSGLDSNGDPLFADTGLAPGAAEFYTATADTVLRRGGAPLVTSYDHPTLGVSWGIWDGVAQPVELATDAADPTIVTDITQPLHWLTVAATDLTTLGNKTGQFDYRNVLAFDGIGSDGNLNDLYMNLAVDFDTAAVSGDMHLYTTNEFWDVALAGNVSAPGLDITTVSGTVNGSQSIAGTAHLMFAGSAAEALAGMASFEVATDPSIYLDSMFLVDNAAVGDLRLSGVTLDRVALATVGSAGSLVSLIGRGSSGPSPVIGLSSFSDPGQSDFWLAEANEVLRQDSAPDLVAAQATSAYQMGTPDPAYEVSWGAWNGQAAPFQKQTDPIDPTVSTAENVDLFWISLTPTPVDAITGTPAGRTGMLMYDQAATNWVVGRTDAGAIDGTTFSFYANVDFDTGSITTGSLGFADAAANYWNASFSGTLNGSVIQISAPLVYYNTDYTNPAAAEMQAVFTGPNAEGIAGSFDFDYLSGTASAEGVFLVNCSADTNC